MASNQIGIFTISTTTVWINEKDLYYLVKLIEKDLKYLHKKMDPRDFHKMRMRGTLRGKLASILNQLPKGDE